GCLCRGPSAARRESPPRPAVATWGTVFAPGPAAVSTLRLCLLWQTVEPEYPQAPTAGLCLLPLCRDGCLSLWRGASLPQYAGTHGPLRTGCMAGSLRLARPPRATPTRI